MAECSICAADNQEELETLGLQALAGHLSFRQAAIQGGMKYPQSLSTHMKKHYVGAVEQRAAEVASGYDALVNESVMELQREMSFAPPELKPLYAVAIQNLVGLRETKPSQQHLIAALKAIYDIRGMKLEQALLLDYAKNFAIEAPSAQRALEA